MHPESRLKENIPNSYRALVLTISTELIAIANG
jgi:hypothetical protein